VLRVGARGADIFSTKWARDFGKKSPGWPSRARPDGV
jgi:hypothetical protein